MEKQEMQRVMEQLFAKLDANMKKDKEETEVLWRRVGVKDLSYRCHQFVMM